MNRRVGGSRVEGWLGQQQKVAEGRSLVAGGGLDHAQTLPEVWQPHQRIAQETRYERRPLVDRVRLPRSAKRSIAVALQRARLRRGR